MDVKPLVCALLKKATRESEFESLKKINSKRRKIFKDAYIPCGTATILLDNIDVVARTPMLHGASVRSAKMKVEGEKKKKENVAWQDLAIVGFTMAHLQANHSNNKQKIKLPSEI